MRNIGPLGSGHSEYNELGRDEDTCVSDDLARSEPICKAILFDDDDEGLGDGLDDDDGLDDIVLLDDDDDASGDKQSFHRGWHCPSDALDALEFCGRIAFKIVNGEIVSPEEATRAACQAIKCLAHYGYEQQEWFADAWFLAKKSGPHTAKTNGKLKASPAAAGSDD